MSNTDLNVNIIQALVKNGAIKKITIGRGDNHYYATKIGSDVLGAIGVSAEASTQAGTAIRNYEFGDNTYYVNRAQLSAAIGSVRNEETFKGIHDLPKIEASAFLGGGGGS